MALMVKRLKQGMERAPRATDAWRMGAYERDDRHPAACEGQSDPGTPASLPLGKEQKKAEAPRVSEKRD